MKEKGAKKHLEFIQIRFEGSGESRYLTLRVLQPLGTGKVPYQTKSGPNEIFFLRFIGNNLPSSRAASQMSI